MQIILGTAQIGMNYGINNELGQIPITDVRKLIRIAKDQSIKCIDTAIGYGSSEKILGESDVQLFNIITKLPLIPDNTKNIKEWVEAQVEGSLKRLKVKKIYCLFMHYPNQLMEHYGNELYSSLFNMKKKGWIDNIGISVYDPSELEKILPIYSIDIVQLPFNLFDRRFYEQGWFDKLSKMNIKIFVRSIFLQGLLLNPNKIKEKFLPWKNLFSEYHMWLKVNQIIPIEACIHFIKSYSIINGVIVGVDKSSHLDQIMKYFKEEKNYVFPIFNFENKDLINPSMWKNL